ncbi:MAG: hypothetical protein ACJAVR_000187 [Paracoccaceae bacterium]|jgi:hypothetical protein
MENYGGKISETFGRKSDFSRKNPRQHSMETHISVNKKGTPIRCTLRFKAENRVLIMIVNAAWALPLRLRAA